MLPVINVSCCGNPDGIDPDQALSGTCVSIAQHISPTFRSNFPGRAFGSGCSGALFVRGLLSQRVSTAVSQPGAGSAAKIRCPTHWYGFTAATTGSRPRRTVPVLLTRLTCLITLRQHLFGVARGILRTFPNKPAQSGSRTAELDPMYDSPGNMCRQHNRPWAQRSAIHNGNPSKVSRPVGHSRVWLDGCEKGVYVRSAVARGPANSGRSTSAVVDILSSERIAAEEFPLRSDATTSP